MNIITSTAMREAFERALNRKQTLVEVDQNGADIRSTDSESAGLNLKKRRVIKVSKVLSVEGRKPSPRQTPGTAVGDACLAAVESSRGSKA